MKLKLNTFALLSLLLWSFSSRSADFFERQTYPMKISDASGIIAASEYWAYTDPDPLTGYSTLNLMRDTWNLSISGSFVVAISEYGYNCIDSPFGPLCQSRQSTIQLINPDIAVDAGMERPFDFPTYPAYFNNPEFSGDNGPCAVTLPGSYCTGFSSGPLSSFQGSFDGVSLTVDGIDPDGSLDGVDYQYQIVASVVPLPAGAWLFGSALPGILWAGRRRKRASL